MSIRAWHWGKIVVLWAWGGVLVALLLTNFLSSPATQAPGVATVTFLGAVLALVALTVVTWIWLGGKDAVPKRPET